MRRATATLLLSTLLLAGCSFGGKNFALMANATWRVTPGGIAYALEVRPGGQGILYRIDGDTVSEEFSAPSVELAIVGLLGEDLIVRRGGAEETLLRFGAHGGNSTLAASELNKVTDLLPFACGPFIGVVEGGAAPAAGCLVGTVAYLFTDDGRLFRVKDGIAMRVEPTSYQDRSGRSGPVVELHALPDRIWVGIVTNPGDTVQYSSITETSAP